MQSFTSFGLCNRWLANLANDLPRNGAWKQTLRRFKNCRTCGDVDHAEGMKALEGKHG